MDAFARALPLAPDPTQLDPLIEVMKTGEGFLTFGVDLGLAQVDIDGNVTASATKTNDPYWGQVSAMQSKIAEWTGDASDNFRSAFLPSLATVPANQSLAFRGLNLAALATRTVYEHFLLDLGELVTKARAALHPQHGLCPGPKLDVVLGLAIGISKMAVGFATLEEGAGVFEIGAGGLELINALHEAGKEEGGESYSLDEPDVEGILDATNDILNRIVALLGQREQDVIDIIQRNDNKVAEHPKVFVVAQPDAVAVANKAWADRWVDGKSVNDLWNQFD